MSKNHNLLATSASIEGITKLINQFYFSTSCYVQDGKVYNKNGLIPSVEVVKVKSKFHFRITQ